MHWTVAPDALPVSKRRNNRMHGVREAWLIAQIVLCTLCYNTPLLWCLTLVILQYCFVPALVLVILL